MIKDGEFETISLSMGAHAVGVSSPYSNTSPASPFGFEVPNAPDVKYKKTTYEDTLEKVNTMYEVNLARRYSSAIDALASFVKGKKHVHQESQRFVSRRLRLVMIPALVASAIQPILIQADSIQCTENGKIIVGSLAGLVTCLIGVANMLRLDACIEAHRTAAHQYDKLHSLLEFQSGQVLLFSNPSLNKNRGLVELRKGVRDVETLNKVNSLSDEDIGNEDKSNVQHKVIERLKALRVEGKVAEEELVKKMSSLVEEVEIRIRDIKDGSQFAVPQEILCKFPITSNTNIFSVIKRVDDARTHVITELAHVTNNLRYEKALRAAGVDRPDSAMLSMKRRSLLETVIQLNSAYSIVDEMFARERINGCTRVAGMPCRKQKEDEHYDDDDIIQWIISGKKPYGFNG